MTDQSKWVGEFVVKTFDTLGANELRPFVQAMADRLGFGAQRYGRANADLKTKTKDMVDTAILRAQVALAEGNREGLGDAANFLFLAYRTMPDHEASTSSPGVVKDGIITGARGTHESTNGQPFVPGSATPAPIPTTEELLDELRRRIDDVVAIAERNLDGLSGGPALRLPVRPSEWANEPRHYTGGPLHVDVI